MNPLQEPAQRKLILYMSMSLDGFAAAHDGRMEWLGGSRPYDDQRQRAVDELLGQTGALVLGRGAPRRWRRRGRARRAGRASS